MSEANALASPADAASGAWAHLSGLSLSTVVVTSCSVERTSRVRCARREREDACSVSSLLGRTRLWLRPPFKAPS